MNSTIRHYSQQIIATMIGKPEKSKVGFSANITLGTTIRCLLINFVMVVPFFPILYIYRHIYTDC